MVANWDLDKQLELACLPCVYHFSLNTVQHTQVRRKQQTTTSKYCNHYITIATSTSATTDSGIIAWRNGNTDKELCVGNVPYVINMQKNNRYMSRYTKCKVFPAMNITITINSTKDNTS